VFLEESVYPPVLDPYASLTPTKLAAFGVGFSHAPTADSDDDGDEEDANDDEETEDNE
jgi:hypothetical protein